MSQWETDQTLPTLDNLLRLKELLGVSVDELLSPDEATNQSQATVNGNNCADESYSFTYTNAEIAEVYRKMSASAFIKGKIYYESHLYFEESAVENFERELTSDNRWLTALPNELVGISMASIKTMPITYDYCLIYNIDSNSFNSLPKYSGTYHFINMYYQIKSNQMTIIEYDIEYYTL